MKTTHLIIALLVLLAIGAGAYILTSGGTTTVAEPDATTTGAIPVEPDGGIGDGAQALDELLDGTESTDTLTFASETVIGQSVNGTDITAHHYGNGQNEVLLVTGVHGADSANTVTLGQELMAHLQANESLVPEDMRVTVIDTLNPDGLAAGSRFNANDVDLNRNFGCDWAPTSQWRDQEVSGGTAPYSEPESAALRNYIEEVNLVGALVWFAAEGKVYPAACESAPNAAAIALAAAFADASQYGIDETFDAYQINGDLTNWLSDEGVPTASILLTDRENTERSRNIAGLEAALQHLAN